MSDIKHTPGPWQFHEGLLDIVGEYGDAIGRIHPDNGIHNVHDGARIVACVNACQGMADPEIDLPALQAENEAYDKALRATVDAGIQTTGGLVDAINELIGQRDQLLAALESYVAKFGNCGSAYTDAKAALAKIKEA